MQGNLTPADVDRAWLTLAAALGRAAARANRADTATQSQREVPAKAAAARPIPKP